MWREWCWEWWKLSLQDCFESCGGKKKRSGYKECVRQNIRVIGISIYKCLCEGHMRRIGGTGDTGGSRGLEDDDEQRQRETDCPRDGKKKGKCITSWYFRFFEHWQWVRLSDYMSVKLKIHVYLMCLEQRRHIFSTQRKHLLCFIPVKLSSLTQGFIGCSEVRTWYLPPHLPNSSPVNALFQPEMKWLIPSNFSK